MQFIIANVHAHISLQLSFEIGSCVDGKCICFPGFTGEDCGLQVSCKTTIIGAQCSGHGECTNGKCFCSPSWDGEDCSNAVKPCPKNGVSDLECSGLGLCIEGKCLCAPGRYGNSCERLQAPPRSKDAPAIKFREKHYFSDGNCDASFCNNKGVCSNGKCFCFPGFLGEHCSEQEQCDASESHKTGGVPCSGHGACMLNKCFCDGGWGGKHCEIGLGCSHDCGQHGECYGSLCRCDSGWVGEKCDISDKLVVKCDDFCNGHGQCAAGICR